MSFSVTLDLLIAWLDDVGGIARDVSICLVPADAQDVIYKSLPRLLRHTSGGLDTQGNLWEQAQATSVDDAGGLQRVCRWLRVMACSGAEVPWIALKELLDLSGMDAATEDVYSDLVTAIDTNVTAIDPEDFASFCNAVLTRVIMSAVEIQSPSTEAVPPKQIHTELLSKCMTMLLRSYGTSTADIETTALNTAGFAKQAEGYAKRKPHFLTRPAKISLSLDAVIAAADLLRHPQYPPEVTLDFLHLLFAKTPLADNVDGFVCACLYSC